MSGDLKRQFNEQRFANGYELVDGVAMHAENGERFQIPHPVLKKHVGVGHFVELRIDSPRFAEQRRSQLSIAELCGQGGIPFQSSSVWRKRLEQTPSAH